jgi:hypothetical protein
MRLPPELLADGGGVRNKGAARAPVSTMPLLVMSKLSIPRSELDMSRWWWWRTSR